MKNFFKIFLLFSFLLLPFRFLQAQNLVPNPSFEQVSSGCPCYGSGIYFSHVFNWSIPNQLSPDLYTQCADSYTSCTFAQTPQNSFGWQMPKQGFNYAGIAAGQDYVDYREWIETKLIDTLIPSKNYCVNFYVSLADSSGLAISNIGVLFSDSLITDISHDSASPPWTPIFHYYPPNIENPHGNIITDTINWTKIEGTYSPNSKKAYIVLGNFDKYTQIDTLRVSNKAVLGAQNFAYYYID
ncbi:MAG: hypothetical protein ABI448_08735, partial [Bacteroidia bacterium]